MQRSSVFTRASCEGRPPSGMARPCAETDVLLKPPCGTASGYVGRPKRRPACALRNPGLCCSTCAALGGEVARPSIRVCSATPDFAAQRRWRDSWQAYCFLPVYAKGVRQRSSAVAVKQRTLGNRRPSQPQRQRRSAVTSPGSRSTARPAAWDTFIGCRKHRGRRSARSPPCPFPMSRCF